MAEGSGKWRDLYEFDTPVVGAFHVQFLIMTDVTSSYI